MFTEYIKIYCVYKANSFIAYFNTYSTNYFYFTVTLKRMMNRWTKQVHCKGGPNETEGANTFVIGFNKETNEMTLK